MNTVNIGGIEVDRYACPPEWKHLVPKSGGYIPQGQEMSALAAGYKHHRPVAIWGHAGTGKNAAIREFCHLTNRPMFLISLAEGTTPDQLIGVPMPKGLNDGGFTIEWRDGILPMAIKAGGVLVLDEINAADERTLMRLHDCFANDFSLSIPENPDNGGKIVSPWVGSQHNGFFPVATGNPAEYGQYSGTKIMNGATLDRFLQVEVDYLGITNPEMEANVIASVSGIKDAKARRIVHVMNEIRRRSRAVASDGSNPNPINVKPIYAVASVRRAIDIALLSRDMPMMRAVELAFVNGINADDRPVVHKMFLDVFATGESDAI